VDSGVRESVNDETIVCVLAGWRHCIEFSLCCRHLTLSANALRFSTAFVGSFVCLFRRILLSQYFMNGLSNLDETYSEHSLALLMT